MVRRWRLIGYFPYLYNTSRRGSVIAQNHLTECWARLPAQVVSKVTGAGQGATADILTIGNREDGRCEKPSPSPPTSFRRDMARPRCAWATAMSKLRIVTLGISGGRSLTRPLRDARRFPSTRW
jgi:hypothetical protein